jgi:hypothetical protein
MSQSPRVPPEEFVESMRGEVVSFRQPCKTFSRRVCRDHRVLEIISKGSFLPITIREPKPAVKSQLQPYRREARTSLGLR